MFKRKKPSSATTSTISIASPLSVTTSTISIASPSSATTSTVSKIQRFHNVPELGDVPHQPKKKFPPREFRKKKKTKCSFQKDWFVAYPWIHYNKTHDSNNESQQYWGKMDFWRMYQLERCNLWGKKFKRSQIVEGSQRCRQAHFCSPKVHRRYRWNTAEQT